MLTTIEAALAAGVVLAARDGTYRDMASMHGSYRKVAETRPALKLLGQTMAALGVREAFWLLDRPVSNSGAAQNDDGVGRPHARLDVACGNWSPIPIRSLPSRRTSWPRPTV